MIHQLADCKAIIPESTNIWQFCVILPGAKIGENCNICSHCFIENTLVKRGASIGAGSTILCGITIGENAMIGIGSVVTHNVPAGEVWVGNPARFLRKVDEYK